MKNILFVFIIFPALFVCSSCSQNDLASSDSNSQPILTNSNSERQNTSLAPSRGAAAPAPDTQIRENKNSSETNELHSSSLSDDELQQQVKNHLGSLVVARFYKPHFIEGDFNNDKLMDAAIVVGAEDRYGKPGEIGDLFAGLPFVAEDVSFQNLRTNGNLMAKPKQSGIDIEKNKTKLKSQSKLGLLIVLSGTESWKTELLKTDYNRKFLLLDALFGSDFENKEDNTEWLSIVRRGENCLPKAARGEGIFSGDAESAGKVIYFNGKNFAWTQCGD